MKVECLHNHQNTADTVQRNEDVKIVGVGKRVAGRTC